MLSDKYKPVFLSGIIAFVFLVSGCKTMNQLNDFVQGLSKDQNAVVANTTPVKNVTDYSDALARTGQLINIFNIEPIYLAVEPVKNDTAAAGKLPANIQIMVESSLNKMGNGRVVVIPYSDLAIEKYMNKKLYIVHGAITEFDAGIRQANGGGGVGVYGTTGSTDFDGEANHENSFDISSIALDFTLHDWSKHRYIPGLQISNKMELSQITQNDGFGFSIFGNGLSIDASATVKQGVHSVLRLLVELSMVELIGRFQDIPYWVAVYDDSELDENVFAKMKADFSRSSSHAKAALVQRLLSFVTDDTIKADGVVGKQTKAKISEYKKENGLTPADSTINEALYEAILRSTADKLQGDLGQSTASSTL